jgi:putative oxidoreductase
MKIAILITRVLLGLVFVVFGLNGFLDFIPHGPLPSGFAGQWIAVLIGTHYFLFVAAVQVIGGILLLINRYVTLGLVLLGPVIVNILLYHTLMEHTGLPLAIVVALLWALLAFNARRNLSGIFAPKIES